MLNFLFCHNLPLVWNTDTSKVHDWEFAHSLLTNFGYCIRYDFQSKFRSLDSCSKANRTFCNRVIHERYVSPHNFSNFRLSFFHFSSLQRGLTVVGRVKSLEKKIPKMFPKDFLTTKKTNPPKRLSSSRDMSLDIFPARRSSEDLFQTSAWPKTLPMTCLSFRKVQRKRLEASQMMQVFRETWVWYKKTVAGPGWIPFRFGRCFLKGSLFQRTLPKTQLYTTITHNLFWLNGWCGHCMMILWPHWFQVVNRLQVVPPVIPWKYRGTVLIGPSFGTQSKSHTSGPPYKWSEATHVALFFFGHL